MGCWQSCSQLRYSILVSYRSLIIRIVFTRELLALNLHVHKKVAIKTSQKQPTDEKFSTGSNVKRENACEGKDCHLREVGTFMKNADFKDK